MPRRPDSLKAFHPVVREWFRQTLGQPSAPQREGWPRIAAGDHTLILAPTGSGKTLAAFLWELNQLIVSGLREPLGNAVHILYVSPLKALNNDVQRNLEAPLAALRARFAAQGQTFPEIRVAVRTGDTPAAARARMIRRSPHVLITTPESLHIMLTSVRGRGMFSGVRAVIVDEIHALAGSKRGAHLALTLERLEELCEQPPQRIGLSATQRPLDEIARFLAGSGRACEVVDCGLVKRMETVIEAPVADLAAPGGSVWPAVAAKTLDHIRGARTTIVFVNNRGQAERMAARINALAGEELALPYHGSLSRERRLALEQSLKSGGIRALVSTSSLELGIDIGSIDLVVQLQSPKRVSNALQRVGRAGHSLDAVSRGVMIPTFRDDAMEMLCVAQAMQTGDVERTQVIQNALDVLAQVLVAIVSIGDDVTSGQVFDLVRRAYPYHALSRAAFDGVLDMLAGRYPADVSAELEARLSWDRATDVLSPLRGARLVAVTSGGTIPDRGLYTVNLADRTRIGELDEEFVHESRAGDVFQLGSSTWRVQSIEHDRVIVTPAPGAPARMPFWHGEYAARSPHLAASVGELRRRLNATVTDDDVRALAREYRCDESIAAGLAEYAHEQRAALGMVPDDRRLAMEQFRDETGSVRVVLHSPFGGRVNAPWGMALANRVREWLREGSSGTRASRFEIQVQTSDDGIMLRLPELQTWLPGALITGMQADEAERRLLDEVGSSSLFGARFRMNAGRALLLPRGNPRRRMPLWLQRLKALDLLQAVREFPSFPILVETYRDVLQDAFDMTSLRRVLGELASGAIGLHTVERESPSPFAMSLQFGFVIDWLYADDAPRAEQRASLLSLDRALLDELLGTERMLEPETTAVLERLVSRRRGTAPGRRARDAAELALLLDRAGDLSDEEVNTRIASLDEGRRGAPLDELVTRGRVRRIEIPFASGSVRAQRFVLTECTERYARAFGAAGPARDAARREIVARFTALAGVFVVDDVLARYAFDAAVVEQTLDAWARAGKLVRVKTPRGLAWCSRKLLEQARRIELADARKQVAAVELPAFARMLQRWQHVAPGTRLSGDDGARAIIEQMAGVSRPLREWEREYLPARLEHYAREPLDRLLASGELAWIGGSGDGDANPNTELRTARFLLRGTGHAWLSPGSPPLGETATLVLNVLQERGDHFFDELEELTKLSPRKLRDALQECVAAGLVTNDTMAALDALGRWRPLVSPRDRARPDPTRWLPADYTPSAQRYVVQRRPNVRRLPRWQRPDRAPAETSSWSGRWSIATKRRLMGEATEEAVTAELIARQWLSRYGIVSREMWRRERPALSWPVIYRELRRLEFRGDVRRGYFVRGLSGAQFAAAAAVDELRQLEHPDAAPVVIAASDPSNPYSLPVAVDARDAFARRVSSSSLLVTVGGLVVLVSNRRGSAMRVRADATPEVAHRAIQALVAHLGARSSHDIVLETIDGAAAANSARAGVFLDAGFRRGTTDLRFYR